jgi:3-oxoacyl-[acyl-carrier protein] reductase
MAGKLSGKVAVISGASRGIGQAAALALAGEGAHVVVTARTKADLDNVVKAVKALKTGAEALAVPADLRKEKDVEKLRTKALATFGQVDILVNNAGVGKAGSIATLTTEDYDWMMDTNMRSTWLCTKAFFPAMVERKDGAVIFIGSVAGLMGIPGEALYNTSKFAQMGFAQALDYEAHANNVRVSMIAPGGVHTHFGFDSGWRDPNDTKLQEFLDPESVAEAVVFAATQPAKGRIFMIGMRPMREALTPGAAKK